MMNIDEPLSAPIPRAMRKIMIRSYSVLFRHGRNSIPNGAENEHAEMMSMPRVHAGKKNFHRVARRFSNKKGRMQLVT